MRDPQLFACLCLLGLAALVGGAGGDAPALNPAAAVSGLAVRASRPSPAGMDPADPKTWQPAIDRCKSELSGIAKALIAVANDRNRSHDARREAVLQLGKIGNPESLDFLTSNASMKVPVQSMGGDRDALLMTPCAYALSQGDWNTPKAVIESLGKPKTKEDLIQLLNGMTVPGFGPEMAHALLRQELRKGLNPAHRENILAMRELAQGAYGKPAPID